MNKLLTATMGALALGWLAAPGASGNDSHKPLFDGKSLKGWEVLEGERRLWRVEDGAITAGSLTEKVPHNSFLASEQSFHNFELRLKIRITGTEGFVNSGIQIRSMRIPGNHEMIGYQADAGKGWWGKLYDESRRRKVIGELIDAEAVRRAVKPDGWNDYRIRAEGKRIRSWINGVAALDYTEAEADIPQDGRIGLQVHGNGKTVVRFKDVTIQTLPPTPNAPTWKKTAPPEGTKKKTKSAVGK